jgi:hypothetical protein
MLRNVDKTSYSIGFEFPLAPRCTCMPYISPLNTDLPFQTHVYVIDIMDLVLVQDIDNLITSFS